MAKKKTTAKKAAPKKAAPKKAAPKKVKAAPKPERFIAGQKRPVNKDQVAKDKKAAKKAAA